MEVILLVGGGAYPLPASDARWLAEAIRRACLDAAGRPLSTDASIAACIRLADVLYDSLESSSSPEPIRLQWEHAKGLLTFVLHDEVVERSAELAALYEALCRFGVPGR